MRDRPANAGRGHDGLEVVPVSRDLGGAPGMPASMRAFSSSGVADVGSLTYLSVARSQRYTS